VGGTELHVRDLLRALALPRAVVAYPGDRELVVAEVFDGDVETAFFYRFALRKSAEKICIENDEVANHLRHWLDLFAISGVHIQHLLSWPIVLGQLLKRWGIPYVYTSHDFYAVCPNWNLFDYRQMSSCLCEWKDPADPGCLPAFASSVGHKPGIALGKLRQVHRQAFLQFWANASAIVFPSESARGRVLRALGVQAQQTEVIEHGCDVRLHMAPTAHGQKLHLAVVGNVATPVKGERNYEELIRRTMELPIEWHFFGSPPIGKFKQLNKGNRVHFHGPYHREDIADLLVSHAIDLCVMLPNVDETFSYVLSEALAAGVPVLATAKGSLPERLEESRAGVVVKDIEEARHWIERACHDRGELRRLSENARAVKQFSSADNARAYLELYRRHNLFASGAEQILPTEAVVQELVARTTNTDPAAPPFVPQPRYQKRGWYPAFLSIKSLVPAPVRKVGRAALVGGERFLNREHLATPNAAINGCELIGIRLVERLEQRVVLEVLEEPASMIFQPKPFRPEWVDSIRLAIRRLDAGRARARLLWVHSFEENFTDEKSLQIELSRHSAYRVLLVKDADTKQSWLNGPEIVKVRLDLVSEPGAFEVGPLDFGGFVLRI